MKRFELLDASCCLGEQYFVQDTRNRECYYQGASFQAACEVVEALGACKPSWQARTYKGSKATTWIYATFGDLQAARAVSVKEIKSMRNPDAYLAEVFVGLEIQLHKNLAEQARAGR